MTIYRSQRHALLKTAISPTRRPLLVLMKLTSLESGSAHMLVHETRLRCVYVTASMLFTTRRISMMKVCLLC